MSDMTKPMKSGLRMVPILLLLAAAVAGAILLGDQVSFETLRAHHETLTAFKNANYLLSALIFVMIYAVMVAFSLPGAVIATLTGGFLFGVVAGAALNVTAATLGATAIFLAARAGFGERLAARLDLAEGRLGQIKQGLDANQWSMLFFIRLVPVVPFFVANLLPALLDVPLRRYVVSTFLGIIPGGLVYTSIGAGLGEVLARGETPDLGIIFAPHVLFPLLGLAALALLPVGVKAVRGG